MKYIALFDLILVLVVNFDFMNCFLICKSNVTFGIIGQIGNTLYMKCEHALPADLFVCFSVSFYSVKMLVIIVTGYKQY